MYEPQSVVSPCIISDESAPISPAHLTTKFGPGMDNWCEPSMKTHTEERSKNPLCLITKVSEIVVVFLRRKDQVSLMRKLGHSPKNQAPAIILCFRGN
jgi:hypothetical protein